MKKIALLFILLPSVISSQNLIMNGDFELGLGGWYLDSTANYQVFSIESADPFAGSNSLRVDLEEGDTASFGQLLNVEVGNKYQIGYAVKTSETENYTVPLIQFIKGDMEIVFSLLMVPEANTVNWKQRAGRVITPDESEQMIFLYFFYGPGTIWLDNIYITEETDITYSDFTVNLTAENGTLKNLFQSNGIDPGGVYNPALSDSFEKLGIDYVRTHDFAIGFDHGTIVGIDSETYDPSDPSDYNFEITDSMAANIYESGGKIFYRFGQSYNFDPLYSIPPTNIENWSNACVGILKHFNDGWADGYNYNIDYCEIWNEPDLLEFWSGDIQEFIALYRTASTAIKTYNSDLQVGGPAFAIIYNQKFVKEFLDSVVEYDLPLDFFSYHLYYLPNPYQFKLTNDYVRNLLDSYGLQNTEIINTEWNNGYFNPDDYWANTFTLNDPQNAASLVSTLNYIQETDIDMFFRYSFRNYWFGLCEDNGDLRYSGKAYKAFYDLYENGNRLETSGGDTLGITITATTGSGGVQILVADNCSSAEGYNINFNETDSGTDYNYIIYRIDENNYYEIVENSTFNNLEPNISVTVTPPFVDHIVINPVINVNEVSIAETKTLVYPNPTKDFTTITLGSLQEQIKIKIYDPIGKLVSEQMYFNTKEINIDLSGYDPGTYLISMEKDSSIENINLIITE
jgi:hypothetical protein